MSWAVLLFCAGEECLSNAGQITKPLLAFQEELNHKNRTKSRKIPEKETKIVVDILFPF